MSSVGRANGIGFGKDGDGLPPWLAAFLHATYFERCSRHADSHQNQCKMFCTDCMGDHFCFNCARIDYEGHSVIQVVRASGFQEFIVNKAKVVFLNKRPQTNPGKQVINACELCRKTLVIPFRFCSIGCKFGVKKGDTNLSFESDETDDSILGTESVVSSTPGKVQKTQHSGGPWIRLPVPDQKAMNGCSPYSADADAAPAIRGKRKGTPRRAPFF